MEGINFTKKLGILDKVLSGQKTMFRLVSRKRGDRLYNNTKFQVGQKIAILQPYSDIGLNPLHICSIIDDEGARTPAFAKDTPGWSKASSADPSLMPHFIEITGVKTEKVQDISDRDCLLEGIVPVDTQNLLTLDGNMPFEGFSLDGKSWIGDTPQEVFAAISNKVIKKDVWVNNKMVDVYEFKLVK